MNKELSIVSLIPYKVLPAKLGGEKGIALFSQYLGENVKLTCIGTNSNDVDEAKNYQLLPWLSDSKIRYANIFLYFRIRRFIRENAITHLIIEHPYYGWLAWLIRKTTKVTWVVHSHNIEYQRSLSIGRWWWKALKWYEQWVYQSADINFFISEDDRQHAIDHLNVSSATAFAITYGVEIKGRPIDKEACRSLLNQKHGINPADKLLLFNGALYHHTNYEALQIILDVINPVLINQSPCSYKILVCGKGLPDFFNELKEYQSQNIIYAGFVDDISIYFKAADIFLNPIISGGGVKTKAIEALAYNCTVVSSELGALGIVEEVCGEKLHVIKSWEEFTTKLLDIMNKKAETPDSFYDYYYWGKIAEKVKKILLQ